MPAIYAPGVFNVSNLDEAMSIILTPEDVSTPYRWETETPYITGLINDACHLTEDSVVLDYGCGIGRLSKALIDAYGCRVIGVDISPSMRALAASYVNSSRFFACAPEMLDFLSAQGIRCTSAIAVWVLQHCLFPAEDIDRIRRVLSPGADLFIANNRIRAVPTDQGWVNDEVDIEPMLQQGFDRQVEGALSEEHTSRIISLACFWMTWRRNDQE